MKWTIRFQQRYGLMPILGLFCWISPAFAGALPGAVTGAVNWETRHQTIVANQSELAVAICREQWQSAIDLTTGLIGVPQFSADQRQAYVDLRHVLEALQSRSRRPGFLVNFDDRRFPESVSADRCSAVQEKVNQANDPLSPDQIFKDPSDRLNSPIQWQPIIDRHQSIYSN